RGSAAASCRVALACPAFACPRGTGSGRGASGGSAAFNAQLSAPSADPCASGLVGAKCGPVGGVPFGRSSGSLSEKARSKLARKREFAWTERMNRRKIAKIYYNRFTLLIFGNNCTPQALVAKVLTKGDKIPNASAQRSGDGIHESQSHQSHLSCGWTGDPLSTRHEEHSKGDHDFGGSAADPIRH